MHRESPFHFVARESREACQSLLSAVINAKALEERLGRSKAPGGDVEKGAVVGAAPAQAGDDAAGAAPS